MPKWNDAELIDEQADDDRGRAQENVVDEANDRGETGIAAVFGQKRARENAERRRDPEAEQRLDQTADDRIQQTAGDAGRRGHLGEDVDREPAESLPYERAEDQD